MIVYKAASRIRLLCAHVKGRFKTDGGIFSVTEPPRLSGPTLRRVLFTTGDLSAQVLELAKQVRDLSAQLPDLWKRHITPFHIRNFSKLNCPYRTTISSVNTHPPRSAGMA